MQIKASALAAMTAVALTAGAAQAATTTYDFTNGDTGPFSFGCDAGGAFNVGCTVTTGGNGIGVNGYPDLQPGQIDGFFGSETLYVTFDHAVTLVEFTLGQFNAPYKFLWWTKKEKDDTFDVSFDGAPFLNDQTTNPFVVNQIVTGFALRAGSDNLSDFTLASMTVAPVPLPAAGWLMLGGIGALAAMRRRRKAA